MTIPFVEYVEQPHLQMLVGLMMLVLIAWLANFIVKRILVASIYKLLGLTVNQAQTLDFSFINRLSHVVPALVIAAGISKVPALYPQVEVVVANVTNAFIVLTIALAITQLFDLLYQLYRRKADVKHKPIKSYLQIIKIAIYSITLILVISALFDRSPLILLSGLGALAAVLILVFQDTLLSFVASVQISTNDVIRVGDWVEMPNLNADGDVIDIALHTVKIQNWDKTITTIPTRRFITDAFKNWRGMQESGGRRIKRSLMISQQSVRFLDDDLLQKLKQNKLLVNYLTEKEAELQAWNALQQDTSVTAEQRRLTNIGTFRAYVKAYLRHHPGIHQNMLLLVRQLAPTAEGIPLEIYCFTNTVAWVGYEETQADIFDHLIAIIPDFQLTLFESPSGRDLQGLGRR